MDFNQVVKKRRTIRDFSNKHISKEILDQAINAAFKAPTYNHLREWYFVLIDDMDVKIKLTKTEELPDKISPQLKEFFKDHEKEARKMYLDAIPKQKRMILEAPVLVAVAYKSKTSLRSVDKVYDLNAFASVWCAIENMLLSLAQHDVFGVTFIPKNTEKVKMVLNIPPGLEVASIIPVGYKKRGSKEVSQKVIKSTNCVFSNTWGEKSL